MQQIPLWWNLFASKNRAPFQTTTLENLNFLIHSILTQRIEVFKSWWCIDFLISVLIIKSLSKVKRVSKINTLKKDVDDKKDVSNKKVLNN